MKCRIQHDCKILQANAMRSWKGQKFCTFFDLQSNATLMYRGADKSLARPGRKQANVTVRMGGISFRTLPCRKKKLDDSSCLDVVEIACLPDMLLSLFPLLVGLKTYQRPGIKHFVKHLSSQRILNNYCTSLYLMAMYTGKNLRTHSHSTKVVPVMFGLAVFSLENYAHVLHLVQL